GLSEDTNQLDFLTRRSDVPQSLGGQVVTDVRLDQGEAGVDYEHIFSNDVSGRVLLLQTLEKKVISAEAVNSQSVQNSEDEALRGESILRTSASYIASPTLTVEGGLEAAYNFLDVDASLRRNGALVPLPADNV